MRPLALLMLTACTEGGSVACTHGTDAGLRWTHCDELDAEGRVIAGAYLAEESGREYRHAPGDPWDAAEEMLCEERGVCPLPCEEVADPSVVSARC